MVQEQVKWIEVAPIDAFPHNGGRCFKHQDKQIAIFRFSRRGEWYACQNRCPHKQEMVLSRGLIGDDKDVPKVACPLHKSTFSLVDGSNINGGLEDIKTYQVKVVNDIVYVEIR